MSTPPDTGEHRMRANVSRPLVADLRDPAAGPMRPCPMKLPAAQLERLQAQADRLRCYPSALARSLVIRGLDELEKGLPDERRAPVTRVVAPSD